MRLQLHLIRVNEDEDKDNDGVSLVEQLSEILNKELDQCSIPNVSASRLAFCQFTLICSLLLEQQLDQHFTLRLNPGLPFI